MATTISFTDGVGAATLSNGKPGRGAQFANWTPLTRPYGTSVTRLSDRATMMFKFGEDYGASFDLRSIPVAAVAGVRMVEVADRLIAWLLEGGTCSVATGDSVSSTYATCGIAPGTTPSLRPSNSTFLEYDLSLALINLAGSPVAMICRYV